VKLVDANVLLYAVNEEATHHPSAVAWLDGALSGAATVGFAWVPVLAFLRLSTKVGLFPSPLSVDESLERVEAWLSQPTAVIVEPTPAHARIMAELLRSSGSGGNLVNDAHLAALAIEHRSEIVSYDNDFSRFAQVVWEMPPTRA